jgi:uncharacterized membrane protein YtjA (UPF0391 family)
LAFELSLLAWNRAEATAIRGANRHFHSKDPRMLKWAFIFLLIAIVAGLFGFSDVEATAATIAQWLFGIFLLLFLGALFIGLAIGAKLMS